MQDDFKMFEGTKNIFHVNLHICEYFAVVFELGILYQYEGWLWMFTFAHCMYQVNKGTLFITLGK